MTREIDSEDRRWIQAQAANGLALLARYNVPEPSKLSPAKVGAAILGWRNDQATDRPDEGDAVRALGCLLGHFVVQSGGGNWVVVTDILGTTLAIERADKLLFHPLDAIAKRMNHAPIDEIVSVVDVFSTI